MRDTRQKLITEATTLFAFGGNESFSIRTLADKTGVAPSVVYYHFQDKDQLLKTMFRKTSLELGRLRRDLPKTKTASEMLKQRIAFQLEHAEMVVAVLKFFFAYRSIFPKIKTGYVPDKAYKHIEEVLELGTKTGEFIDMNIKKEAKVITHAINGFVMEYFPSKISKEEKDDLIATLSDFVLRSVLRKGGA